jgi:hypothetical protein
MLARSDIYFRLHLLFIIIHITYISLSLRQTSAPIHLTSVLGVLGIQETSCIVIAGLLERDTFDLFLPEFDKRWVIHLREICCYSTNLCTWRPNTVYKNRSVRRYQSLWSPYMCKYAEVLLVWRQSRCSEIFNGLRSATSASSSTPVRGCNPHVRSSTVCRWTSVFRYRITNR